ncbi:MAG: AMP-binding protein [Spirochaetaceae bacterium]
MSSGSNLMRPLSREAVLPVVVDLIDGEYRRERGSSLLEHPSWSADSPDNLSLGTDGLSLDSLSLLSTAGVVNEFWKLHEAGVEEYLLRRRRVGEWVDIVIHALEAGTTGVTFRSSGSTGSPKPVSRSWERLEQELRFLTSLFSSRRRLLATVPAHHIYGFIFTVLLPAALEIEVVRYRWEELGALASQARPGDLIVSHPTLWRYLASTVGSWVGEVWGVSSTAALPAETMQTHYDRGLDRFVEVYGSTETGGVGYRQRPQAPFELFSYLRRPSTGESATLERQLPAEQWEQVTLLDHLDWVDERRFRPLGRADRVVQVGGVNVDLRRVEEQIAAHPGVREVAVRVNSESREGRLKALIVPAGELTTEEIETFCRERLEPAARPLSFTFAEALPRNPMGKPADWTV